MDTDEGRLIPFCRTWRSILKINTAEAGKRLEMSARTIEDIKQGRAAMTVLETVVVEDVFRNEVKWSGSIQGTLGTWFKESNSFHLKDFVRGNNVRCVYHPSRYKEVHALFENRDAVVHVEGEIKSDVASGRAREIKLSGYWKRRPN